jgi:hypothetical protein
LDVSGSSKESPTVVREWGGFFLSGWVSPKEMNVNKKSLIAKIIAGAVLGVAIASCGKDRVDSNKVKFKDPPPASPLAGAGSPSEPNKAGTPAAPQAQKTELTPTLSGSFSYYRYDGEEWGEELYGYAYLHPQTGHPESTVVELEFWNGDIFVDPFYLESFTNEFEACYSVSVNGADTCQPEKAKLTMAPLQKSWYQTAYTATVTFPDSENVYVEPFTLTPR